MQGFLLKLSIFLVFFGCAYHVIYPRKVARSVLAKEKELLDLKAVRELTTEEVKSLKHYRWEAIPFHWRNRLIAAGFLLFILMTVVKFVWLVLIRLSPEVAP